LQRSFRHTTELWSFVPIEAKRQLGQTLARIRVERQRIEIRLCLLKVRLSRSALFVRRRHERAGQPDRQAEGGAIV
jgi:hypothetical protein